MGQYKKAKNMAFLSVQNNKLLLRLITNIIKIITQQLACPDLKVINYPVTIHHNGTKIFEKKVKQ